MLVVASVIMDGIPKLAQDFVIPPSDRLFPFLNFCPAHDFSHKKSARPVLPCTGLAAICIMSSYTRRRYRSLARIFLREIQGASFLLTMGASSGSELSVPHKNMLLQPSCRFEPKQFSVAMCISDPLGAPTWIWTKVSPQKHLGRIQHLSTIKLSEQYADTKMRSSQGDSA